MMFKRFKEFIGPRSDVPVYHLQPGLEVKLTGYLTENQETPEGAVVAIQQFLSDRLKEKMYKDDPRFRALPIRDVNAAISQIASRINWEEVKENHRLLPQYVVEAVYEIKDEKIKQLASLLLNDEERPHY